MPFIKSKDGVDGMIKRKKKKVKSKATGEDQDEVSDEDLYSDFSDASDDEDEEVDENASPAGGRPKPRFQMERTWSVNAFNVSAHSAGVVYFDDSEDDSETDDDSSSYDEFGEDDYDGEPDNVEEEEVNITTKTKNGKKGNKASRKKKRSSSKSTESSISTKRSSLQFKKEMKQRNRDSMIIPEGDEDDEKDEVENLSNTNEPENESDDDSVLFYNTPFSFKKRPPSITELMAEEDNKVIESGYSSDSALVRKRMKMLQQEQKKQPEGKRKKGGKKKATIKKKDKKKGNRVTNGPEQEHTGRSPGGSLEGDSTVTTISVESLEEARQSNETIRDKTPGKKKKKKTKTKKKKTKDGKGKKKRAVISFIVDGDDEACADFDKRLQEIEQFEASLVEERRLIQKERETMAFERESMEMRMDEEAQLCDDLKLRVKELEQQIHSQEISNAGNLNESIHEKNGLKMDFMREKREYHIQLTEKDREIEELKLTVRDLQMMQGATRVDEDSNGMVDGKSRERLQGELLQTNAKLSEKEAQLESQGKELDMVREEVAALKAGKETSELKNSLFAAKEDNKKLQQELDNERNQNAEKLKDKDETVTFLMNELARLKLEQSKSSKRRGSFR